MLKEIKTDCKRSSNKTNRGKDEHTLIILPDGEPRSYGPKVYVSCGPLVKMFIGEVTEIAAEKSLKDIEYAPIKAAKLGSKK